MIAVALTFLRAYWKPIAVVVVLGAIFAYHRISVAWAHHEGYVEGKAVLQPELDLANANVKKLRDAFADQQRSLAQMDKARAKLQADSAKALADEQAKSKLWQEQATKLMGIIARQPSHDPEVCNRADSLLDPSGL
jgi:uncharacterized protein YqfA (UPF0365 family)